MCQALYYVMGHSEAPNGQGNLPLGDGTAHRGEQVSKCRNEIISDSYNCHKGH